MPARAPPSIDMLQTVMRPSIESARIASPVYSSTSPVPPPTPICEIRPRIKSFAPKRRAPAPIEAHFRGLRLVLQQALRGEHVLDLGGADAERQRPERAVRGGVAVAANDRHAGLREAELGADHVDDALVDAAHVRQRHAELLAVDPQLLDLLARDRIFDDAQAIVGRRDRVIHRRLGVVGPTDLESAVAQPLEGLRRSDLVHEVQINIEHGRRSGLVDDDVIVPDLLKQRFGLAHRKLTSKPLA